MQTSTSPRRKSLGFKVALASGLATLATVTGAFLAGVTPALAADLAAQPDAQVAAFMVPLTLLILALLFEVGRFTMRNHIPVSSAPPRRRRSYWSAGSTAR